MKKHGKTEDRQRREPKHPVLIRIILCILCIGMILGLDQFLLEYLIEERLALQTVYTASRNIPPRTKITAADLEVQEVAGAYLLTDTINDPMELIGRYTDIQETIPKGSPFYASMIHKAEDLPDEPLLSLREGETSFSINTDASLLGSLTAGMRTDILVSMDASRHQENVPVTGVLERNARILAIRDHQGLSMEDPKSSHSPAMIELAVNSNDLELLMKAEAIGSLRYAASTTSYSQQALPLRAEDSPAVAYLEKIQDVFKETVSGR